MVSTKGRGDTSGTAALYDTLGVGYTDFRHEDPRIAARLHAASGDAEYRPLVADARPR